eukprot:TRINITY_DN5127_c0_g1_i5.p1 TRINITY_DN5127_c0_g1~~TRINITY_DN5127_c0_g1_i5.p1  ORF type:complete len:201 (-),score=17.73 TRINITY_DN5127_c0_g1_i5:687-1265(-)
MPTYYETPRVLPSAPTYARTSYYPSTTTTTSVNVTPYRARPYSIREYTYEEPARVSLGLRRSSSSASLSSLSTRASTPMRYRTLSPAPTPARPGGIPGPNGDYVGTLGRAAWLVLHATAEQYPANPTPQEQQTARSFVYSFASLYPCQKCRMHFQKLVRENPPDVSSQAAFSAWVIRIHNLVNIDLGKPTWA